MSRARAVENREASGGTLVRLAVVTLEGGGGLDGIAPVGVGSRAGGGKRRGFADAVPNGSVSSLEKLSGPADGPAAPRGTVRSPEAGLAPTAGGLRRAAAWAGGLSGRGAGWSGGDGCSGSGRGRAAAAATHGGPTCSESRRVAGCGVGARALESRVRACAKLETQERTKPEAKRTRKATKLSTNSKPQRRETHEGDTAARRTLGACGALKSSRLNYSTLEAADEPTVSPAASESASEQAASVRNY